MIKKDYFIGTNFLLKEVDILSHDTCNWSIQGRAVGKGTELSHVVEEEKLFYSIEDEPNSERSKMVH